MWDFSTPVLPLKQRGDGVRIEEDGKQRDNLQDLNGGFRFHSEEAGAMCESTVQSAVV